MARNKYPEVTVEKILDAAQRLFLEKGYENTTIQDIVGELGGLTKGAVYHHFKSKEEIMDAVNDRMFFSNNPFEAVMGRADLTGLEKLRQAVLIHNADEEQGEINRQATALMKNPQMLANMLVANREVLTPYYRKLIDEGIADGSITTSYPRELSELLPILTSLWFIPSIYPATREEQKRKFAFILDMLDAMGLPLRSPEVEAAVERFFSAWPEA